MSSKKPIFGYWGSRGIAQPIRTISAYIGLEVEVKHYSCDAAGQAEWDEDKNKLGLDFPNLPYWIENGVTLTESRAILKYLAREKGNELMPQDPVVLRKAEMLEGVLSDVWYALIDRLNKQETEEIAKIDEKCLQRFEQLNKFLIANFATGDQLSYVDFILYDVIYAFTKYNAAYLDPFPKLKQFKAKFESIPAIAKFINSPDYIKSPVFHPGWVKVHA